MTDDAWATAERTLRAHFASRGVELLDVTQKRDATLGLAFWVRFAAGGGGLALVRGDEVIADPTPASVDRWIAVDRLAHTATVSADDFLYVITTWKAMPALQSNPIRDHEIESLNPAWDREHGAAQFVVAGARKNPGGSRNKPGIAIQRAYGTLTDTGITWKIEDEVVAKHRDELS